MARPAYRARRGRDEDEEDSGRRGRGNAPRKSSGTPPVVLAGGIGIVVVAIVLGVVLGRPPKAVEVPKPVLGEKPVKAEPVAKAPVLPTRAPPKPLTDTEKSYIRGLFDKADPHIQDFRKHAKAGWDLKKAEDNDGANEAWIDAKHDYQKAVQIVAEALEDEDRFPAERPGMAEFNGKLAGWQKEFAALPKVNVTR